MTAKPKHANSRNSEAGGIDKKGRRHDSSYLRRLDDNHNDNDNDERLPSASTPSSAPSPSSAVLSALAFIATSQSSVSGSPLPIQTAPPVFLCPSIEYHYAVPSLPTIPPVPPLRLNNRASTPTPTSQSSSRRRLADKYIKGMDSQWRKTDEWTLFGSTCCSSTSNVNDVLASPSPTSTYSSASVTPDELDAAALPAGWQTSTSTGAEPTIILALSIILAVSLFVFIVACAVWKRRKKKKAAKHDLEAKLRRKLRSDDESEHGELEKEVRGKMRVWAKATARWKANVRQSARRRRKKQSTMSRGVRSHSPPSEHHEPSAADPSRCPSPANAESQDAAERASVTPPDPQRLPEQSLPPAYRPSSPADLNASTSRRTSFLSDPGSHSSTPHAEPAPYTPPTSGHISIDDKRELGRLGELASAPPELEIIIAGSSRMAASVPTFDEALEDLDAYPELEPYSADPHPCFPSPPSKTSMLKGQDIPIMDSIDDGLLTASAPPDERFPVEPSAPSLEDEGNDHLCDHSHLITDALTSHSHPLVPSSTSSSWRLSSSSAMNAIPPSYHP
ncbi:hypothetical protein M404DRAFT_997436 [Pisolithus tinctorius Marx 270]|uniref:Uncharacterized protein n=1 Tax=Pisolithus tinctorius Marx 270 TaxID=870435 RepID=A0A0C3JHE7_PISTI|nr:hypothetical protein M404DRAFT_997436 [Pisolithus tinctorius Marx 270]